MTGDDKTMATKLTHYLHVVIESLVLERKHRFRIVMAIYNITDRKEIPTAVFDMDWEEYGQFIGKSGVDKDLLKIAMTKAAAPIGVEDLRELMGPIKRLFTQLLDKEDDTSKKNVLKVIGGLIDAIDKEDVYEQLADIIREIQGECL